MDAAPVLNADALRLTVFAPGGMRESFFAAKRCGYCVGPMGRDRHGFGGYLCKMLNMSKM